MKVTAFTFLLWMTVLESDQATVSVTVSPDRSQFFKDSSFSVSCEDKNAAAGVAGWRVMKRMRDGEGRSYPSPWSIPAAFPATDSGAYWCKTELGAVSREVNITVTDGSVILQSPVHPLMEGNNLTLSCRSQTAASACNVAADFYKDGVLIKTSHTRNMTILNISLSDQGLYKCEIVGLGDSPESWLTVRAPPAGEDPPDPPPSVFVLVRHLIVGTPYLLSTILLGLIYNDRKREERERRATLVTQTCDDVIMQIIT